MSLSGEDKRHLTELCGQNRVSQDKALKLLEPVKEEQMRKAKLHECIGFSPASAGKNSVALWAL